MASEQQVKQYIASWLQLGRKILVNDSRGILTLSAKKVVEGDRYTQEFESIWQQVSLLNSHNSYLEGTTETIAQLIAPAWEIVPCSLCNMLVATPQVVTQISSCPCHDLPNWPNNNIPVPTGAINSQVGLQEICHRLLTSHSHDSTHS
ncbi:hypothetical protein [Merismopedia glauca]|uniref:Uncharacterized protein n=1 Tax=Merismopedia glauca CCAP 1448/3 TaxID=1296344 RepID=A0A2T1BZ15_9CYAN|nr:hypothetical protein [Merismopedia glauca]PSB01280.1 hypothetical protein C7B64_19220 [Merismopedia glauca CCAP 1448/3]